MKGKKIAALQPFLQHAAAGNYKWCSCGFSKKQPFCDHSHRTDAPEYQSVKITLLENAKVAWCLCKHTATPPWCDGSHHKITQ